jgi:alpha-glucosidase (family GH31 glycosyl hydrolase)
MKHSKYGKMMGGLALFSALVQCASSQVKTALPNTSQFVFEGEQGRRLEVSMVTSSIFSFSYLPQSGPSIPRLIEPPNSSSTLQVTHDGAGFETSDLKVTVAKTLCLRIFDKQKSSDLGEICPASQSYGLTLNSPQMTQVYGLGEEFIRSPDLSWMGKTREPGHQLGNMMQPYEGGFVGNAQFPILYALGKDKLGFALIYDNLFAQTWNFKSPIWTVSAPGGPMRGYFIGGKDLPELRRSFMSLSGRPPLPPKKAFGLWVSEYGFDNWRELDGKLNSLKRNHFPVDGFVLDLQWFGGVIENSELSPMGGLQWDLKNFPDPQRKMNELAKQGIGIVAIEEPYVALKVKDRDSGQVISSVLTDKGFLVRNGLGQSAPPLVLKPSWFGKAEMLDYMDEEFADFWHDWKRQPLIEAGLIGHWTDLGEPETATENGTFDKGRFQQAEIQNIFNRRWSEGIVRGYRRHGLKQRPWILSRSGTIGSQSDSVTMWSGDIGANFESLQAHFRAQAQMSLSGIDYFTSDAGGFYRKALKGSLKELYTLWLANAALFDIPIRPHTFNLCNCNETSPDRIGDVKSNLKNLELRYKLLPYYYSLAHRAYTLGEPIVAPLVYYYQEDLNLRNLSDEKMIGPYLLGVGVAKEQTTFKDVYLPAGKWVDFYTNDELHSKGEWFHDRPIRRGWVHLPLFAREGGIIPTEGADGKFALRIYPSELATQFDLYQDNGKTIDYTLGQYRVTPIEQKQDGKVLYIDIGSAKGTYGVSDASRTWSIEIITRKVPKKILFNSQALDSSRWTFSNRLLVMKPLMINLETRSRLEVEFND